MLCGVSAVLLEVGKVENAGQVCKYSVNQISRAQLTIYISVHRQLWGLVISIGKALRTRSRAVNR